MESLPESFVRQESPFVGVARKQDAVYVEPRVDAEIKFLTIDSTGLLRRATYRGLAE